MVPLDSLWGRAASSRRDERYLEVEGRMRNSREVAFLKGATGPCRWGLHFNSYFPRSLLKKVKDEKRRYSVSGKRAVSRWKF
jgi:hypothetical protein